MIKIKDFRFELEFLKSYYEQGCYYIVVKVLDSSLKNVIGLSFDIPVCELVDHCSYFYNFEESLLEAKKSSI